MNVNKRLQTLSENLALGYEKLSAMERSLIMAYDAEAKISIKQRIREEINPQVKQMEKEYWQLISKQVCSLEFEENDVSEILTEVTDLTETICQAHKNKQAEEIITLLTEIHIKLNELDTPASSRLKATIPLFLPFLQYEVDLEANNILRQFFPTIQKLIGKARKKQ